MNFLDLTLPSPEQNLALDEALLDSAEAGQGGEVLRFWESSEYFVVVGYANKIDDEVNRSACEKKRIPILRRCSGGGTVLQGPGCLNYTLVLRISQTPELATVPQTNHFVMHRHCLALSQIVGDAVTVQGHTDLVIRGQKFSGNAQRRKRDFLIFHGTFLLNFDLGLMEKLLRMPSREPDYRGGRSHQAFLTNIRCSAEDVKEALCKIWGADEPLKSTPHLSEELVRKYQSDEWNFKF